MPVNRKPRIISSVDCSLICLTAFGEFAYKLKSAFNDLRRSFVSRRSLVSFPKLSHCVVFRSF